MPSTSANELTPPAEQVERFRRDLEALGAVPDSEHKLGVAVSGGADSLALLLLAVAAYPGAVVGATVDHGLRPEAVEEAASVHRLCGVLGVLHETLTGTMPSGNLQEGARDLRYALLAEWAKGRAEWVAIAHQRDDIAETLLMRARRGAGVGGLAAMAAARKLGETMFLRPLLGWSRGELETIAAAAGLEPVRDPSNVDPRFDRSRIRRLLATSPELPADRLALAANNLRRAEEALEWAAEREWQARSRLTEEAVFIDPLGLPYELRRRLVVRAIEQTLSHADNRSSLRGESLDRLVATLDSGGTGTIAGVKAAAKRGEWRFSAAPARRSH